jgi:hypothetical protein
LHSVFCLIEWMCEASRHRGGSAAKPKWLLTSLWSTHFSCLVIARRTAIRIYSVYQSAAQPAEA